MSELTLIDIADTLILRPSEADAVRRAAARIAELEAERDYHVKAHDSATLRIAQLTKRVAELEAEVRSWKGAAHEYEEQIRFLKARYEP